MDRPLSKQVEQSQKQQLVFRSLMGVMLVALVLYGLHWLLKPSLSYAEVRTAKVQKGAISSVIKAGGVVVPMTEETITSEFESRVINVVSQVGSMVEKGDVLLELDTQKIDSALLALNERIAVKQTQIKSKTLNLNKELNRINSQIELLQIDLESRETRLQRLDQLSELGAFSSHELLEAKLNVQRSKIELRQLKQAKEDAISTTNAEIEVLGYEASLLENDIAEQQRLLALATVKATRSGVITYLQDEAGASVKYRSPLAKIADLSGFKVEATLSDFYASQLLPSMAATVRLNDQIFAGRLMSQSPAISKGTMKVVVTLDQPNNSYLKPNQRVDVALITQQLDDALTLSKGPFVKGTGVQSVFVLKDDVAYQRQVRVGISDVDQIQVIEGLTEGEEVIISDLSEYLHLNQITVN